jgi:hypothetical protein
MTEMIYFFTCDFGVHMDIPASALQKSAQNSIAQQ